MNAGRMMNGSRPILRRLARASSKVVSDAGDRNVEADLQHQFLERKAVFAFVDGFGFGADHFDAVTFQRAALVQGHGGQAVWPPSVGSKTSFAGLPVAGSAERR